MISVESICTGSMSSPTLSALMIHEINPTMKIWPGCGRDEEPVECTILFDIETALTPQPGAQNIDRISSAVLRGVSNFRDPNLLGALHVGNNLLWHPNAFGPIVGLLVHPDGHHLVIFLLLQEIRCGDLLVHLVGVGVGELACLLFL